MCNSNNGSFVYLLLCQHQLHPGSAVIKGERRELMSNGLGSHCQATADRRHCRQNSEPRTLPKPPFNPHTLLPKTLRGLDSFYSVDGLQISFLRRVSRSLTSVVANWIRARKVPLVGNSYRTWEPRERGSTTKRQVTQEVYLSNNLELHVRMAANSPKCCRIASFISLNLALEMTQMTQMYV